MKCCVIIYHSNALKIYKREWIEKCVDSIKNQNYSAVDIFELNYGEGKDFFAEGYRFSVPFSNHIQAMNYLIDMTLQKGYDIIFNTNLDDYYDLNRFAKQVAAIDKGAQLVSSNFNYFNDDKGEFKKMNMTRFNIRHELLKGHNVIAHPVVAFHKSFFIGGLRYNNLLGYEDKDLWQRAIKSDKQLVILPDYLLNYRIHENQITKNFKG